MQSIECTARRRSTTVNHSFVLQGKLSAAQGREITGKLTDQFTVIKQKHTSESFRSSKTDSGVQDSKIENSQLTLGEDREINNNRESTLTKKSMKSKAQESEKTGRFNEKKRKKIDKETIDRPVTGGVKKLKSAKLKKHKQTGVR